MEVATAWHGAVGVEDGWTLQRKWGRGRGRFLDDAGRTRRQGNSGGGRGARRQQLATRQYRPARLALFRRCATTCRIASIARFAHIAPLPLALHALRPPPLSRLIHCESQDT